MSVLRTIAEAVTQQLNAATLSRSFTAERTYLPLFDTKQPNGLKVFVLGRGEDIEPTSRDEFTHTYSLALAVYERVDPADTEAVDVIDAFREEIIDFIKTHPRLDDADAVMISVSNPTPYDPQQLDQHSTFVSVIEATYQTLR